MKTKTFQELCSMGVENVYLRSFGYIYYFCLNSRWTSFNEGPSELIKFTIKDGQVFNMSYWPEENIKMPDLFKLVGNKWISVSNYDMFRGMF